jgi:hypothetical protein
MSTEGYEAAGPSKGRGSSGRRLAIVLCLVVVSVGVGGYRVGRAETGWRIPSQSDPAIGQVRRALFAYYTEYDTDILRTFCHLDVLGFPQTQGSIVRAAISDDCEQWGLARGWLWNTSNGGDFSFAVLVSSSGALRVQSLVPLVLDDGSTTPAMKSLPAGLQAAILKGKFRGEAHWSEDDISSQALRSFACTQHPLPASRDHVIHRNPAGLVLWQRSDGSPCVHKAAGLGGLSGLTKGRRHDQDAGTTS